MNSEASDWFTRRTSAWTDWPAGELTSLKGTTRVSVVLPALDEESTIGGIVSRLSLLRKETGLIDEIVVVDSGSRDATVQVAKSAGADVYHGCEILPRTGCFDGKGEVLWKALAVTTGEIIIYVDSDLLDFNSHYITGLLGPMVTDSSVCMVKAFYDRPVQNVASSGGGRVTELMARPLLAAYFPDLAGVIQPLAGEYAVRREIVEELPFAAGYGVDIGLLIDTYTSRGLDAIAQVDLGLRAHEHQDNQALGQMAATILAAVLQRHPIAGEVRLSSLTQFARAADGRMLPTDYQIPSPSRPPIRTLLESVSNRPER